MALPNALAPLFRRRFVKRLEAVCTRAQAPALHAIAHGGVDFHHAYRLSQELQIPFFLQVHDDVVYTFKINTRGRSAKQPKAPLPYSAIERALPTYAEDGADAAALPNLRTKALVTVGFSTLLRRSELVVLEVADSQPSPEADDGLVT